MKKEVFVAFIQLIYTVIFLFIFAFTALVWSFQWFNDGIYVITKSSKDTAIRDINDLIDKGILQKEAAGGRSTSYELKIFLLKYLPEKKVFVYLHSVFE